ncbi:hypothetical protein CCR85_03110 [Rhodothalassium salexigens]|uniref:YbjN domain-containing protein n=1 Tax=Rhodothalassium salexigens DSM 2132 TaxID=1188247 RepID=A0A4R2PEG5_RHOSA|nr:hypothetical protein [Rhodothalassium salexigens]MBB4212308.1 hypothetical protein [Rhodothalassium salexigens DSM 2132]MBK1638808.1 hypothetical protein [Rhodothalassium salexigens DSM 2132]MBK5910481.1 hypothetical protein [Rhodothalassium salexigens]TCP32541.1 hypothetical protein EV659_10933 [Rhodothalassium salexigens DSM 2132]
MPATSQAPQPPAPTALDEQYRKAHDHLQTLEQEDEVRARFVWHGVGLDVLVSHESHNRRLLRIDADLGCLPYSAEGAAIRDRAIDQLKQLAAWDHPGFSLDLSQAGRVSVRSSTVLDADMTMDGVFRALSIVLLDIGPGLIGLATHLK